ncbi:fibritin neck whiskers protein [Klebsiella phage CPRSB]|nr:fibritin neck whiskers protein [Klebsiella phage CPRSB]
MQETRITKLEDDWALSEVGQLTEEVKELRAEMGDSGSCHNPIKSMRESRSLRMVLL